jgi:hypothetical protein
MTENDIPSERELIEGLRRRKPLFSHSFADERATVREVDVEFRRARQGRSDVGLANHVFNLVLEPRNPFEPARMRKPKLESTVFGTLVALVVVAVLAFNLAAPTP